MTKNKQIILVIIGIVILLFYMNQSKEKEFKKGASINPTLLMDTRVQQYNGTLVDGTSDTLGVIESGGPYDEHTYLKFSMSGITGTVTNAILTLHAWMGINIVRVRKLNNSYIWDETTTNWNSRAILGTDYGSVVPSNTYVNASGGDSFPTFDVTSIVNNCYTSGYSTCSFILTAADDDWMGFDSKESGGTPPSLSITYTSGPTPLVITDLTDINFDGLTNQSYGNITAVWFYIRKVGSIEPKGYSPLDGKTYSDGTENSTDSAWVFIARSTSPLIDLRQGDYITLDYDSKNIKIYFPLYRSVISKSFYPSSTGETYYDSALTNPACTIANGCVSAAPTQCTDGTPLSTCSTNKPYYCSASGQLSQVCGTCGCPTGQTCQGDGTCITPSCDVTFNEFVSISNAW